MKYLLLLLLIGVLWWRWKKAQAGEARMELPPVPKSENMLACSHCGVHQPASDCLRDGERVYCCAAHRQAARTARS